MYKEVYEGCTPASSKAFKPANHFCSSYKVQRSGILPLINQIPGDHKKYQVRSALIRILFFPTLGCEDLKGLDL